MNYYDARQIKEGPNAGKWHYTRMNDNVVWPVGKCRDGCPGHDTKEGAYEHQRQYLIDNISFHTHTEEWPKYKCQMRDGEGNEACSAQAKITARIPGEMQEFLLCEEHATKDSIAPMIRVGERISSY